MLLFPPYILTEYYTPHLHCSACQLDTSTTPFQPIAPSGGLKRVVSYQEAAGALPSGGPSAGSLLLRRAYPPGVTLIRYYWGCNPQTPSGNSRELVVPTSYSTLIFYSSKILGSTHLHIIILFLIKNNNALCSCTYYLEYPEGFILVVILLFPKRKVKLYTTMCCQIVVGCTPRWGPRWGLRPHLGTNSNPRGVKCYYPAGS